MSFVDPDTFKSGMRRLASGVSVVTACHLDRWGGLAATSVSSVSVAPPVLLVCINEKASAHALVEASGAFCVNVLGREAHEVALRFGSPRFREERFAVGTWEAMVTGAPSLREAIAVFDCRVESSFTVGTHTIFCGGIVGMRIGSAPDEPLLYFEGGYHSIAQAV